MEQTEEAEKKVDVVDSHLIRLLAPLNYNSETLEGVEHQIEDRFRRMKDSLEDSLGGNGYEDLTAYNFFGKADYLMDKNKRLEKMYKK